MIVFFFKQKTTYEMRISDWSSDVCSSDLLDVEVVDPGQVAHVAGQHHVALVLDRPRLRAVAHAQVAFAHVGAERHEQEDRKSVAEGKSVSVRVDIGGRRIIKKKKKNNICHVP